MKLLYEKETIEQVFGLLNGLVTAGLDNVERLASASALLRKYEIIEEEHSKVGENIDG